MSTHSSSHSTHKQFSDLLFIQEDGRLVLQKGVHPLENLLEMKPQEILDSFMKSQVEDFKEVILQLENPDHTLYQTFSRIKALAGKESGELEYIGSALEPSRLLEIFLELHTHVMEHPVWKHPFFLEFFKGEMTLDQVKEFAIQYFNQIKNTRQCVSLAQGRFFGLSPRHHGPLSERISEITQVVLAQLLADEYGVSTHTIDNYPTLDSILDSRTHMAMYRQLFEGLKIPFLQQDAPMLHGVADNVLIQRLVAGSEAFSSLEALASVGLGMEWGVPEFFSLLLGGAIRFSYKNSIPLNRHHLQVFIAHVKYDVLHAISVMLVTALYIEGEESIRSIKGAVNILMAGRYAMMSDLHKHIFGTGIPSLNESSLEERYFISNHRIENELLIARQKADPETVQQSEKYKEKRSTPFLFTN